MPKVSRSSCLSGNGREAPREGASRRGPRPTRLRPRSTPPRRPREGSERAQGLRALTGVAAGARDKRKRRPVFRLPALSSPFLEREKGFEPSTSTLARQSEPVSSRSGPLRNTRKPRKYELRRYPGVPTVTPRWGAKWGASMRQWGASVRLARAGCVVPCSAHLGGAEPMAWVGEATIFVPSRVEEAIAKGTRRRSALPLKSASLRVADCLDAVETICAPYLARAASRTP